MAVCIAVIGKDNGPLIFEHLQSSKTDALDFQMIVSSSLDIIEERVLAGAGKMVPSSGVESTRELYLGVLNAHEDYKVFGYMTNTKIKYIIILEENNVPIRENEIRMMFRRLHGAYCDLMLNPFYLPGEEIKSKRFKLIVSGLMSQQ